MHWWLVEQGYRWAMIPTEKSKIDLDKLAAEIDRNLKEPIPGITSEDRFDELVADSWDNLQSLPGQ